MNVSPHNSYIEALTANVIAFGDSFLKVIEVQ